MIYLLDEAHGDELVAYHVPACTVLPGHLFRRGSSGSTFSSTTSNSRCCCARRCCMGALALASRKAALALPLGTPGADGCFLQDLFCDILASPLNAFCLASSSDLRSKKVSPRRDLPLGGASALRFASRRLLLQEGNLLLQQYDHLVFFIPKVRKKTRDYQGYIIYFTKNSTDCPTSKRGAIYIQSLAIFY